MDKSDALLAALRTLAANRVADMEQRQATVGGLVDNAVADAASEMARLKAEAADAVTEKRKEVMYKIKDLKIEIGTTFKKAAKADKKAQIEAQVSELESFINKTIRDYDEGVADQIALVSSATAAATAALENELTDATEAFSGAKGPAETDLDRVIEEKIDALDKAFDAKNEDATEVHTYLTNNYARYLQELLAHILDGSSEEDREYLLATALDPDTKTPCFSEVFDLNDSLQSAMTKKLKSVKDEINAVKSGKEIKFKHAEDGRIARDANNNKIILGQPAEGFVSQCLDVSDRMVDDITDVQNE
jgi:hypothetical protein